MSKLEPISGSWWKFQFQPRIDDLLTLRGIPPAEVGGKLASSLLSMPSTPSDSGWPQVVGLRWRRNFE